MYQGSVSLTIFPISANILQMNMISLARLFSAAFPISLVVACTAIDSSQTSALWTIFQERCLVPAESKLDFLTDALVEIPPEEIFPEDILVGLVEARAFRPNTGDWRLFVAGKKHCSVLSQKEELSARNAAMNWENNVDASKKYEVDHHLGNVWHGTDWYDGFIEVSHGDAIFGWRTAFAVIVE